MNNEFFSFFIRLGRQQETQTCCFLLWDELLLLETLAFPRRGICTDPSLCGEQAFYWRSLWDALKGIRQQIGNQSAAEANLAAKITAKGRRL